MFEIRVLSLFGYRPNMGYCALCKREWEELRETPSVFFSLEKGTLICSPCSEAGGNLVRVSLGTARLIEGVSQMDLAKLPRLKFTAQALSESRGLLPRFITHQLGKELKSLVALSTLSRG